MNKYTAGLLLAVLCASFTANAARPSIVDLQVRVIQLENDVLELQQAILNGQKQPVLVDATGTIFGDTYIVDGDDATFAGFAHNASVIWLGIEPDGSGFLSSGANVVFDGADCMGTAYISNTGIIREAIVFNNTVYAPAEPATQMHGVTAQSWTSGRECMPLSIVFDAWVADTSFQLPSFVTPFKIELR